MITEHVFGAPAVFQKERTMSMSVVVWVACGLSVPGDLPEPENWRNYGHRDWAFETVSWQVIVEPAEDLEMPVEIKSISPGALKAVLATVEPSNARKEAYKFLNSVAVAIATKCGGAVLQGSMGLVHLNANGEEIES